MDIEKLLSALPEPTPLYDISAEVVQGAYGEMLRKVRQTVPSAVLVGGAVRDTIFGREVKDLDFMVTDGWDGEAMSGALGVELQDVLGFDRMQGRTEYDGDANIYRVFESGDKKVNVLLVGDIVQRVCTFPDSISQVIFDGERVLATQAFIDTANTRVITHSHEPQRELKAERRERLALKYPDFTFRDII